MKALLLSLAVLASCLPAFGQADDSDKAERERLSTERAQADARFAEREAACYKGFAVNDCLKAARTERRERVSDLRRQELLLNEAQRKRRADEKLRSIEERAQDQRDEDAAARSAKVRARQAEKDEELAARAAKQARTPASGTAHQPKVPAAHDTAKALQESEQRHQEAKERQERVAKRQAEAAKSGVKPLPAPPP